MSRTVESAADLTADVTRAPCVLVISSDPDIRGLLVLSLQDAGFETRAAEDGTDGWRQLERERPDAVVTGLSIPGINGFEIIQRIRGSRDRAVATLPVLVVTGRGQPWDIDRGLAIGASRYFPIPVDADAVVAGVRELTAQRGLR